MYMITRPTKAATDPGQCHIATKTLVDIASYLFLVDFNKSEILHRHICIIDSHMNFPKFDCYHCVHYSENRFLSLCIASFRECLCMHKLVTRSAVLYLLKQNTLIPSNYIHV